jgi:ribosome biogenesis GTPase / thiamine phosphate phosphatase
MGWKTRFAFCYPITSMTQLEQFGWSNYQSQNKNQSTEVPLARIVSVKGFKYYLMTERGELEAELAGKLLYGLAPEEIPKVGDWVQYMDYETMGYIVELLPRINELSRKNPGSKNVKQVLAANIDYALIVQGLDDNFNIMRLERYIVQLTACGIAPVVILNKADLVENEESYRTEVQKLKRDCPVYFCSTYSGKGIAELVSHILQKQKTYILIGSSGVGKSSLLNAFMNTDLQKVNTVSDSNAKGKHTTTTRDLFQLPNGSLVIDTPGMREFGMTSDGNASEEELFPAIQEVAVNCRYSDCRHLNETGCAVIEAVQTGELSTEVYDSYLKLIKEQRRFEIRIEDKKRLHKQFGKMSREANEYRKKYKF